ncbi:hypothetical protein QAD02_005697 [Eretmocerus hayati]|uniref:Uncharacterized protein n=1 Tax=Eretmocerus hayati TaxID=131215 RepID=A0ACC2NT99_9HYME|nr:hypothetical protein QAD02_005697 [Eretmocerus hayati]
MAKINIITFAIALWVLIQIAGVADGEPVSITAIGVISGVMGIIEFLKARYSELQSSKEDTTIPPQSDKWEKFFSNEIHAIYEAVMDSREHMELSRSMSILQESFSLIYNKYNATLIMKKDFEEKNKKISRTLTDDYIQSLNKIIQEFRFNSPLKTIYETVEGPLPRVTLLGLPFLKQYEVRDSCV